jgi:hypothetical protein
MLHASQLQVVSLWLVVLFQTRDPDLESGDDLEETDREYCQVLLPPFTHILNYLNMTSSRAACSSWTECSMNFCVS